MIDLCERDKKHESDMYDLIESVFRPLSIWCNSSKDRATQLCKLQCVSIIDKEFESVIESYLTDNRV